MADDRAVISAELDGASEVVADAKKIANAFNSAAVSLPAGKKLAAMKVARKP